VVWCNDLEKKKFQSFVVTQILEVLASFVCEFVCLFLEI